MSRPRNYVLAAVLAAALGWGTVPATPAQAAASCEVSNDFTLQLNQTITSCGDGSYTLVLQGDGNLVLTPTSQYSPMWYTGTGEQGVDRAVMQSDGNLVLYAGNTAKWFSDTADSTGARLAVQSDGNLVIYRDSTAVWDRHNGTSFNTRPDFGNCEPAFVVEDYGNVKGTLGVLSAGHCDSKGKDVYAVHGPYDYEIIPLDVNRLNAPTVASGKELMSANHFKAGSSSADSFVSADRNAMEANPRHIGAVNHQVCRYGGVSGKRCGNIVRDNYRPSYIPGSRDFYLLDFPCIAGDSGSAVVSADGTRAVGIVSGRRRSDGACIVSRLDQIYPGALKLYQPPPTNATYTMIFRENGGDWIGISAYASRSQCADAVGSYNKNGKNIELRCIPNS